MIDNVIILAAGKGTRMNSELPKCACTINNIPMIKYIIDTCTSLKIKNIIVVVGYKKDSIISIFDEYKDIQFVIQKEQLGTADACFAAYDKIKDNYGNTLIIPGDMPLIKEEVIKELYLYHLSSSNKLTVLSTSVNNPKGYGRIYRENESVKKIIEESDATPKEKSIKEINTGVYLVDNQLLFEALKLINSNNNQHEFYLTDIVEIINNKYLVGAYLVPYSFHLIGVNDYETLNYVEKCLNDSI
jgi:bifunctional UDP-N-acetylglucosamine pyrophosphorylase/glucosamine-1-phosphate N-acetyltransferase